MSKPRAHSRRRFLAGGLAFGAAALVTGPAAAQSARDAASLGLEPDVKRDQTALLQRAIDQTALDGRPLFLPVGRYQISKLEFKTGAGLIGVPGKSILEFGGGGSFVTANQVTGLRLKGLVFDGGSLALEDGPGGRALVSLAGVRDLLIADCKIINSSANGLGLRQVSGAIRDCEISAAEKAGLFSQDANGLDISHNRLRNCADNGILVWRTKSGEDGTLVSHNRISGIRAQSGGSGQNGNGVNVFRADGVLVQGNRISDCAFSAVRANAASNCQILANRCARIGEVALYAEFAFEGAIIANNVVDGAAMGISVTNFMPEGGRLAVVQGNIVRDLKIRADGSRGIGIAAEADTVISANVVESAERVGIQVGWGPALRDIQVSANVVRRSPIGIGASVHPKAGRVLITDNVISEAKEGAIRAMDHAKAIGPDLALESPESYPNLAIYGNVAN